MSPWCILEWSHPPLTFCILFTYLPIPLKSLLFRFYGGFLWQFCTARQFGMCWYPLNIRCNITMLFLRNFYPASLHNGQQFTWKFIQGNMIEPLHFFKIRKTLFLCCWFTENIMCAEYRRFIHCTSTCLACSTVNKNNVLSSPLNCPSTFPFSYLVAIKRLAHCTSSLPSNPPRSQLSL